MSTAYQGSPIHPWLPTMTGLTLFLAIEPFRPLFFRAFGDTLGFDLFLAIRVITLAATMLLFWRSTLHFDWISRAVPSATAGADSLLSLRGFACLIVLMGHGTLVVFKPSDIDTIVRTISPFRLLMASPWVGVWIFFVLSGYLMGKGFYSGRYSLDRSGILQFYRSRLLRIAPLYWCAILLVAVIQARGVFQPENLPGFVSSLLFFQSVSLPFVTIGALWSVQTEMGFYLAAPFLFVGLSCLVTRFRPANIFIAFVAAGSLFRILMLQIGGQFVWIASIFTPTISNLDLFCGGMLVNWLIEKKSPDPWDSGLITAGLILLFFGGAWIHSEVMTEHLIRTFINFGPSITAFTVSALILRLETVKPHGWPVRSTQWFGILTYAVYVVHEPILAAIRQRMPDDLSKVQSIELTVVAIIATIAVAAIAYWLIERPFDFLKRRKMLKISSSAPLPVARSREPTRMPDAAL
jgi:peptidoglycan/LPS O-acetylase OafA/YrhL